MALILVIVAATMLAVEVVEEGSEGVDVGQDPMEGKSTGMVCS